MKITHNEALAASRAYYATVSLREVKAMTKRAYDDACSAYDRAYLETKKSELAKLESEDANRNET
jgi:hypothetical protein